jgi:tetratricopeptide (TPR) repeat protein
MTQEVAYNLMSFAQRHQLHQAIAEWYETVYRDDIDSYYPLLGHHWLMADHRELAIDYLEKAGEHALRSGAYREAVTFFSDVLRLAPNVETPSGSAISEAQLRRAHWQRQLGLAYYGLGNVAETERHLLEALRLLGRPMPRGVQALSLNLSRQLFEQSLHRLWPKSIRLQLKLDEKQVGSAPLAEVSLEAARVYEPLGQMYYLANEAGSAIYAAIRALNLAERAGPSPELARSYAIVGTAAGVASLHRPAEFYLRRAWETTQEMDDQPALAWVLTLTGVYRLGVGQWPAAHAALEEAVAIYDRFGDRRGWGDSVAALGWADYFAGRFDRAPELLVRMHRSALESDNLEHRAWSLFGQSIHMLRRGEDEQTIPKLEEAAVLFKQVPGSRLAEMDNYGALAIAYLRRGALAKAETAVMVAAQLQAETPLAASVALDGYANIAQACLALWQREAQSGGTGQGVTQWAAASKRACEALRLLAAVYPIGRPQFWLRRGRYHFLQGKQNLAYRAWQNALREALHLAMPYDRALAHAALSRHLPAHEPSRLFHRDQAARLFKALGAAYDLDRLHEAE